MTSVMRTVAGVKAKEIAFLKDRDPTKSQAVYVQEDRRTFMITQDAAHNWTVTGAEL
jgi:hypothetical protein